MTHIAPMTDGVRLSIMIPTRERSTYLGHAIRACLRAPVADMEVLVLDNASMDATPNVVAAIDDPRLRYERSDRRLSMRDNFERGLRLARGKILCFIGDDDAIIPSKVADALAVFDDERIDALSANRVHYAWPDLAGSRRNSVLVPRHSGRQVRQSRAALHHLLHEGSYYDLPCLYHGFVRRRLVDRLSKANGRFFLSSQVDMFSAIALSVEDIRYVYSLDPFFINGGSARSNGASHFKGGTEQEREMWKIEDELGFLPPFDRWATIAALLVESALRLQAAGGPSLHDLFDQQDLAIAMEAEVAARAKRDGGDGGRSRLEAATGVRIAGARARDWLARPRRIMRSFWRMRPANMAIRGRKDVDATAEWVDQTLALGRVGLSSEPVDQIRTAIALARDR